MFGDIEGTVSSKLQKNPREIVKAQLSTLKVTVQAQPEVQDPVRLRICVEIYLTIH
jgi:hypothetical protein